ncbi:hypothetical protein WDZ11_14735 [Roseomonas mucosa]|uniref:hypothetical protein n=1 Tax=Roseomonas mucosa TaxID=207340 RepID=UPI0030D2B1A5
MTKSLKNNIYGTFHFRAGANTPWVAPREGRGGGEEDIIINNKLNKYYTSKAYPTSASPSIQPPSIVTDNHSQKGEGMTVSSCPPGGMPARGLCAGYFSRVKRHRPALWSAIVSDRCLLGEELAAAGVFVFPWVDDADRETVLALASRSPALVSRALASQPDASVGILHVDGHRVTWTVIEVTEALSALHLDDFVDEQRWADARAVAA